MRSNNYWIAGWMAGGQSDSKVAFQSRPGADGSPLRYHIYVTSPENNAWILAGTFSQLPTDPNGLAVVDLNRSYFTHGVLVYPKILGADENGNRYFQLRGLQLLGQ